MKLFASALLALALALPAYSQEKPQEPTVTSPALSAAGEKRLSDAWSKVLDGNTAFKKALDAYNAIAVQEADKGKFPKGTSFDVSIGNCAPEQAGGYHCKGVVTPKLPAPQAAAVTPVPAPVTPAPVNK